MAHSDAFARHFSRLIWLLLNQGEAVDEQEAALRAAVAANAEGATTLTTRDWRLYADGAPLADDIAGLQDLVAQMIGHAVNALMIDQGAPLADILATAVALASEPGRSVGRGAAFAARLSGLEGKAVRAIPEPEVEDVPAPRMTTGMPTPTLQGGVLNTTAPRARYHSGASFLQFTAPHQSALTPQELFAKLDGAPSGSGTAGRCLEELESQASTAAAGGARMVVTEIVHGLIQREAKSASSDLKLPYRLVIRRLLKPAVLKAVADLLPANPDRSHELLGILAAGGEDGVDALIQHLTVAPTRSERRVYFDALVRLRASVPVLVEMLNDSRWYVARNAADLLGEIADPAGEAPLVQALKHGEDRVRSAAAAALTRLGTPRAVEALRGALRDVSPRVRTPAAAGLAVRKETRSTSTLIKALGDERDSDVQIAIVTALGRLGTPEAVDTLIQAAKPEGWLARKKPASYRAAAVHALGEAHTPAALAALKSLANDREREVRDAVARAATRASSPSHSATSEAV